MKNKRIFETGIKAAAILVLLLLTLKCTAQTLRISTDPGLILFTESGNPDEICVSFGLASGELAVKHLGKSGNNLKERIAAAARMADEAGVDYRNFLRENRLTDSRSIRIYFAKCQKIRRQFLSVMPERALLELRTLTAYF